MPCSIKTNPLRLSKSCRIPPAGLLPHRQHTRQQHTTPTSRDIPGPRSPDVTVPGRVHITNSNTWSTSGPHNPKDPNKAKLAHTLRTLQPLLPTLLRTPLPTSILSPNITLHLFPTTHPHLPNVTGHIPYQAALYTSPIAMNRLPFPPPLTILHSRITPTPHILAPPAPGAIPEQLLVRWRTTSSEAGAVAVGKGKGDFEGLWIFQFDQEGRILSHTIETAEAGLDWEKGFGATVVGVADWLLGGFKGAGKKEGGEGACPAFKTK